jgi:hypothetical protein
MIVDHWCLSKAGIQPANILKGLQTAITEQFCGTERFLRRVFRNHTDLRPALPTETALGCKGIGVMLLYSV